MSWIVAPLLTCLMSLTPAAPAAGGADALQFICDPINYPNGMMGLAEVRVEDTGSATDVVVEYYDAARVNYLGRYQELGSEEAPSNEAQARDFAFNHFYHRQ